MLQGAGGPATQLQLPIVAAGEVRGWLGWLSVDMRHQGCMGRAVTMHRSRWLHAHAVGPLAALIAALKRCAGCK